MTIDDLIRSVQHQNDNQGLMKLKTACEKRMKTLARLQFERSKVAAWDEAKTWVLYDILYCNAHGTFIGGKVQRGTRLTFLSIQPRKKIAWFKLDDGSYYWFSSAGLVRYNINKTLPENPISKDQIDRMQKLGEVVNEALRQK